MTNIIARRSALAFAAASLVLGASAPAFALTPSGYAADGGVVTFDGKSGNFCVTDDVVGSRIAKTTCQSQGAWAAEGLNISRK